MIVSYVIPEEGRGRTVLSVLRKELGLSASLVRRLKHFEAVYADGKPVYTNHILSPGEKVSADVTAGEAPCGVVPEDGDIDIIFENEWMTAVNKPHGMIVHPSHSKYTGTLANFVSGHLLRNRGSGTCHAVNRLDRDTSGIVLFASNGYAKDRLTRALNESGVKEYTAIVCGRPEKNEGTVDAPIKRLRERELLRVVAADGQSARTHYEVKSSYSTEYGPVSVLSLVLKTGRTHQIRVHCLHMGCPVLGDRLYCTEESSRVSQQLGIETQLLHAGRLSFTDPFGNGRIMLEARPDRREFYFFDENEISS